MTLLHTISKKIVSMICNILRLLVFVLLVNTIFGSYGARNANQQLYQLLKQRSIDSDNEYVWFTRDTHDNFNDENMKPNHQRKIHNRFHLKNRHKTFNPKHTVGENAM
ncbi:unnamed protein product [Rotaria socialis]|uniref:Uncharacterized protein n=2 Tax=Rotaria socialis TaxID=392032 RepID=A0A818RWB1_9BILA|nr:unnamed protein product [Rotaria socialis]CAF3382013.1 unnamed protein product [Rotaria socialis]CAF3657601.1 unnamed protein product [Rotaria socialis]CAF3693511.1 unnamed protein product [Rotaria socialis]